MNWAAQIEREGYGITEVMFDRTRLDSLGEGLKTTTIPRSRAGMRHMMKVPAVSEIANSEEMLDLASSALNEKGVSFRATLFDKSPSSNWLVAWHQDTALPLQEKCEINGWGPWSVKEGVIYAHAPAQILEKVIALRLHLDDSNAENGPLRVLPGTHRSGVMSDEQVHKLSEQITPVECYAPAGAVVLMRPLLVHASSKGVSVVPRRVLHIEYTTTLRVTHGMELAIA
jgi:ectoine hydroxylase-related dioxygenase (phytanoyl-CoA dioxygenase family)